MRREPLWQTSARLTTESHVRHEASVELRARGEALGWLRRLLGDGRAER